MNHINHSRVIDTQKRKMKLLGPWQESSISVLSLGTLSPSSEITATRVIIRSSCIYYYYFCQTRVWMIKYIVQFGRRLAAVSRQQTLCCRCAGKVAATVDHVWTNIQLVNLGLLMVIVTKTQGTCGNTVRSAASYVHQVRHVTGLITKLKLKLINFNDRRLY
jgi:hypothetical protein